MTPAHRPPTPEEIQRVRLEECRQHGHDWNAIMGDEREDPLAFICGNCGRHLAVVGDGINR